MNVKGITAGYGGPGNANSPRIAANDHGGCGDEYAWLGPADVRTARRGLRHPKTGPPVSGGTDNASEMDL